VGARAGRRHGRRRRDRHRPGAHPESLDTTGLDLDAETLAELLKVDNEAWRSEIPLIEEHFALFGEHLPDELADAAARAREAAIVALRRRATPPAAMS
jgi:GTP-dependent phosphoenolpyruvate carboxykinase